jgi:hypothetical protein
MDLIIYLSNKHEDLKMHIPETIAKDYLIPKDFEKPVIEIGNYYLKWDATSYGVQLKEIPRIKESIRNAIPLFDSCYELLARLERSKGNHKEKHRFRKLLSPQIHLALREKEHTISYELYMYSDGSTFIHRVERILVIKIDDNNPTNEVRPEKDHTESILFLKWMLGELLFNRQGFRVRRQRHDELYLERRPLN